MVWDTFSSLEEWKEASTKEGITWLWDVLQEKALYELNPISIESLDPDSDYSLFVDYEDALHNTPDEIIVEELKLALDEKINS